MIEIVQNTFPANYRNISTLGQVGGENLRQTGIHTVEVGIARLVRETEHSHGISVGSICLERINARLSRRIVIDLGPHNQSSYT